MFFVTPFFNSVARAADDAITEEDVINGTMNITSRRARISTARGDLKEGSPAIGCKDQYHFNMNVAKTTQYDGDIIRQPKLYSSVLGARSRKAKMSFNIYITVLNPTNLKQSKDVGKWVGDVTVDPTSGAYDLGAANLRIAIDQVGKAGAFDR